MAIFYPAYDEDKTVTINGPLTLTRLQTLIGGFVKFVTLSTGDTMVINEAQTDHVPINKTASSLAGKMIRGGVIVCESEEIA